MIAHPSSLPRDKLPEMTEYNIREAITSDLDPLVGLWRELEDAQSRYRRFFPATDADVRVRAAFAHAIESLDECVLVASDGPELTAMAHCKIIPATKLSDARAVELGRVVVTARGRSRGIGRAIVSAAEGWGRLRGATVLRAGVFAGNDDALAFWRGVGFEDFVSILSRPID